MTQDQLSLVVCGEGGEPRCARWWCGSFLTAPYAEITEVDLHHLEFIAMHHITINIKDDRLAKQVVWWLEHFKDDGLEIVSVEDLEDLKALQATRQEASVSFEDYLSHAD